MSIVRINQAVGLNNNSGMPALSGILSTTSTVVDALNTLASAGYVTSSQVGAANGAASLDSAGKLPVSQLPSSITGAMVYQGTWDASTNTPTLTSGSGTKGWFYKVSVAGTTSVNGISQWNAGDMIAFDGTTWDKIDGISSEVSSVFGRTGAVVLTSGDVSTALGFTPASAYSLPLATSSSLGGIKIGSGLNIDGAGVVTAAGPYTLAAATSSVLGGIKVGSGLSIDGSGVLSATAYSLPAATSSVLGGVKPDGTIITNTAGAITVAQASSSAFGVAKVDGTTITAASGVISATPYSLPTATTTVLGGVKVDGTTITAAAGIISATQYTLPVATGSVLGGVKAGSGVTIAGDGTIAATYSYTLPVASSTVSGGVKVGAGLTIDGSGVLYVSGAVTTTAGITTWTGTPYDITGSTFGNPATGQMDIRFYTGRGFILPANLNGSIVKANTAASSTAVFLVQKNASTIATLTFAAGSATATFSNQSAVTFVIGDHFQIVAPVTPDATLADIDYFFCANLS